MGGLMRAFDWTQTPLGAPENWPLSLRTTIGIVLHSAFPMFLFWGKDLLCFYNDAYRPSLGMDGKHPAIGKNAKDIWPETWAFISPLIDSVMATGEATWHEDQLLPIYRNGKLEDVYWTFSYSPAYGDNGDIEGVFVTCTETTGKVTAMAAFKESKDQLQFAVDAAELGTWELNPVTYKFTGNRRLKEWFGLKPEEEIELALAMEVIAEKDRAKVNKAIAKALTYGAGGLYNVEYTIQNAVTGKDIVVKAKGKAYFDKEKQPYTFSGTLQDVTEEAHIRKQLAVEVDEQWKAKQKLEESEQFSKDVFYNSPVAKLVFVGPDMKIERVNRNMLSMLGRDESIVGKTFAEAIPEISETPLMERLRQVYATGIMFEQPEERIELVRFGKPYVGYYNYIYKALVSTLGEIYGIMVTATDVSEQVIAKTRLEESELFSRDVFHNSPVAKLVFVGPDMKIERVNRNMLNMLGRDESIVGKTFAEAIPEISGILLIERLNEVYATGAMFEWPEERIELIRFGKPYVGYYNYIYKALVSTLGEIYGVMVTATDVSEQVIAKTRLEESELFSRDVFYNSPVAKLVFVGPDMKIERVNENMLSMLGRDESIIGKTFTEAIPEISETPLMERLRDVYTTGVMFEHPEERIELVRFGKPYVGYYNYIYKALVSTLGGIYGVMVTATDVSEQVIARQIIEAKEKELRDLITASPIGICVVSGSPVRVEEVNDRFLLISGKTRAQYAKAPYWEVLHEVAHIFEPVMESVFKTGEKYTTEENEMVLIRDGVEENIFLTFEYIPVIDSNQVTTKVIVMAMEVTHQVETRKKIEAAVMERTKELAEMNVNLQRSNAELEQFAYIASHDLQEPIRKISTFTQMLESNLTGISDKSKDYIEKIYNSTDRMTKLIRDVLAFSQISSNTDGFEKIDLAEIIKNIKTDFELVIEQKNAVIEVEGMPVLRAIPSQMTQLFSNLMSNSLKYTKPGVSPVISISSSVATKEKVKRHPQLDAHKKYHHIQFSDNGIGFDQEHADRIFKIFQRLHAKADYEGTGIGLSICRKIVNTHLGHISAAVGAHGGAVFHILLPE
jgi:PAS domain S-box-containing protein